MEIRYERIDDELYKVFIDGNEEKFCLVALIDNPYWEAWNEMASRSAKTKEEAVKLLVELLY